MTPSTTQKINKRKMFNLLGGLTGGGGTPEGANNTNDGITFDEVDAAADFENQLRPPPLATTITQQQGDDEVLPVANPAALGKQQLNNTTPPHPRPQTRTHTRE